MSIGTALGLVTFTRTGLQLSSRKTLHGKTHMGIAPTAFPIGPDGHIRNRSDNVKVDGHAEEVVAAVWELAKPS